jgi:cyanophycinase
VTKGRLVLAGSGEFTPAMNEIDAQLLGTLGPRPRVAIVPTAAGLEVTPPKWAHMGSEHFSALGAEPVPVMVLNKKDAHDPKWLRAIDGADWIYFSGGSPSHAVETLAGSPFWGGVLARLEAGAILAGSSAGAMMLGQTTFVPLARGPDGLPTEMETRAATGVLPQIIVVPHFDIIPLEMLRRWSVLLPADHRLLGIDEDTAIVQDDGGWIVRGKGRAIVFRTLDDADTYTAGARLDLRALP